MLFSGRRCMSAPPLYVCILSVRDGPGHIYLQKETSLHLQDCSMFNDPCLHQRPTTPRDFPVPSEPIGASEQAIASPYPSGVRTLAVISSRVIEMDFIYARALVFVFAQSLSLSSSPSPSLS